MTNPPKQEVLREKLPGERVLSEAVREQAVQQRGELAESIPDTMSEEEQRKIVQLRGELPEGTTPSSLSRIVPDVRLRALATLAAGLPKEERRAA